MRRRLTLAAAAAAPLAPSSAFTAYVLRHGQTDRNAAGIEQGSSDLSRLTDLGRRQAGDAYGALLGGGDGDAAAREVTSVYASPLARARQTLGLLREADAVNPGGPVLPASDLVLPDLREVDLYDWEGRGYGELRDAHPGSWDAWERGIPEEMTVMETREGEEPVEHHPLIELWERADAVWDEILSIEREKWSRDECGGDESSAERTALIVAHGNLGQALLGTAMGWDASGFNDPESVFGNCGLCEVDFGDAGGGGPRRPARRWRWRWPEPSPGWNRLD